MAVATDDSVDVDKLERRRRLSAERSKRYRARKRAEKTGQTFTPNHDAEQISSIEIKGQPIEGDVLTDKETQQKQIADVAREVEAHKSSVAKLVEEIDIEREQLTSFDRVQDLLGQLENARKELAQEEANNKTINDLKDNLAEARRKKNYSQSELSMLCVQWVAMYKQRSVFSNGTHREIVMAAKLGKEIDNPLQLELPI